MFIYLNAHRLQVWEEDRLQRLKSRFFARVPHENAVFESILGSFWGEFGPCWGHLGPSWVVLGPSLAHRGVSFSSENVVFTMCFTALSRLRRFQDDVHTNFIYLNAHVLQVWEEDNLQCLKNHFFARVPHENAVFESSLGSFWGEFGPSWGHLGPSWVVLGPILAHRGVSFSSENVVSTMCFTAFSRLRRF